MLLATLAGVVSAQARAAIMLLQPMSAVGPPEEVDFDTSAEDLIDRVVYLQDFDDPTNVQPVPIDWYRIDAPGFPTWNEIGYLPRRPTPGQPVARLYELTTQGGSTGIRLKAGAALVYAGTDHGLWVRVRTQDLHHARARVMARLLDVNGHAIPGSEVATPPINTAGAWHLARLQVLGDHAEAVSIQVDLRLEQPEEWMPDPRLPHEVRLRDVRGRVQFDRLVIWRSPRIEVGVNGEGNLVQAPDRPEIQLQIRDIPRGMREARLAVYDRSGRLVDATRIPFELGRQIPPWVPQLESYGWYRAVLEVYEAIEQIGTSWVDFAWLPRSQGDAAPPFLRFGVVADDLSSEGLAGDLPIVTGLGMHEYSFQLWPETLELDGADDHRSRIGPVVDALVNNGIRPTFVIESIPQELAAELVRAPHDVAGTLAEDGDRVWNFIEPFLIDFGQRVGRWQILQSDDETLTRLVGVDVHLQQIHGRLRRLVPEPTVVAPWVADRQIAPGLALAPGSDDVTRLSPGSDDPDGLLQTDGAADTRAVSTLPPGEHAASERANAADTTSNRSARHMLLVRVPHEVRPQDVPAHVELYQRARVPAGFLLETLDPERYGHAAAASDLMKRAILAWESGAPELWLKHPWEHVGRRRIETAPTPLLPIWRTLASHLSGRRSAVRLAIAPDVTAIIFHGPNGGTMAVWHDAPKQDTIAVRMYLGEGTAWHTDGEGNRRVLPIVDGEHHLTIDREPRFIDGIDVDLALFRAKLRVTPGFVEASSAMQQHDLVLYNPWKVPLSGRFRITGPPGWRFSERMQRISIPPNTTRRYPLDFSLPLNELAGATAIEFEMQLQARSGFTRLRIEAPIEVGHRHIVLTPSYYLDPRPEAVPDLVIRHEITNRGKEPVWLNTFVTTRGFRYREQPVSNLAPGETAIRLFRFEGGGAALAGQRVKVGLRELDGSGQLNLVLDIQ